nr:hypothetical protein [Pseudopedobacter sp.]
MKKLHTTILILLVSFGFANAQYLQDVQGRPIMEISYTDIKGTPFLFSDWVSGVVILGNGDTFSDVPLKYNVFDEKLYFKNPKKDELLEFVQPLKSFKFNELKGAGVFSKGFPAIDKFNSETFYDVLFDGKVKLLNKQYKTLLEVRPYNSATIEKSFVDHNDYYLVKGSKIERIRNSKKDFLDIFSDKSAQIEVFIKNEKIDFKNNDDLVKVFNYYDSL